MAAMPQRDGVFALRHHLDLVREPPDEQALEPRLLRVAQLGLAGRELPARGVDPMDELEQLCGAGLDAAGEDIVGIERGAALALALGHRRAVCDRPRAGTRR
jgi:hypothetical protein